MPFALVVVALTAFVAPAKPHATPRARADVRLLFGNAFANDPNLSKPKNQRPKSVEVSFSNGRTVAAIPGQKLSDVARAAGAKIKYDCKNGECGTCTVKLNGRNVRTCVAKVPGGSGPFRVQVGDVAGSAAAARTKGLEAQLRNENKKKKKGLFG